MRILIDESLPARLARELDGYKVKTVVQAGWSGKKNGELLRLAEENFDVFITIDQNMQYQINLIRSKIPIFVLAAKSNRFEDLILLLPKIKKQLKNLPKGVIRITT